MATRSKSPKRRSASPKRKSMSPKRKSMSPKRKSMRKRSSSKKTMKRSSSKRRLTRKSMKRSGSKRRLTRKSRSPRKTAGKSAYANFRKANFKKMMADPKYASMTPRQRFAAVAVAVAAMFKKAGKKTMSAMRKMKRSPRKVRKMRMSKKRAMKKSGSPRRARKDKGVKRSGRKISEWAMFVKKYSAAKKAALGTNNQRMVLKALAADWRAGVRSY